MTSTIAPASQDTVIARRPLLRHGAAAAVLAAAATTALAALASATGVSFADGTGASIPLAAFTELTLVFSLLGVGLAATIARAARRPRAMFVRTAALLTGLSVLPDIAFGFDAGSAATLIALHLAAALIMIPTLARQLRPAR
jgi:hypothetical protein